jgi:hypothetical protein
MRPRLFLFAVVGWFAWIAAVSTAVAQNPFTGTWKLNQEKSQLAGDTMKFGPAEGGALELTTGGTTYSFLADGNNYRMPSGDLAAWKQTSPDSWTTDYKKIDGKLLSTDTWKLSSDSNNLTVTSSGTKPNGDSFTDTEEYVRTTGTSGLMGSWKSTEVKLSSPSELGIEGSGPDGLLFKIAALKASCVARFDGKEMAVEGPDIPTGLRVSLARTGPYGFRMVQKLNGSVVSTSQYTVSEDGKTMIEVGNAPGDPPQTMIWEKQ